MYFILSLYMYRESILLFLSMYILVIGVPELKEISSQLPAVPHLATLSNSGVSTNAHQPYMVYI